MRILQIPITVGGNQHRNCVPCMPDMSWLGDPPSERMAARYEVARVIRHREALAKDRSKVQALEARADELARTFVETPKQRKRVNDEINKIQTKLQQQKCTCDICGAK